MSQHKDLTKLSECCVTMSNAIIRAAQALTLSEKRMMSAAIARLNSIRGAWTPDKLKVKLTAAEYAETFGLDIDTAYDELAAGADSIMHKQIRRLERRGKHERVIKTQWVGRSTYAKGEGWIEIAFWHELAPYLLQLKEQFTTYRLEQASAIRSLYAWRLLELLQMFEHTGMLRMSIEEFHHAMDTPASYRSNFKALRIRVIEPAIKELRNKDNWIIEWTAKKRGRKYANLEFRFHRNPQGSLDLTPTPSPRRRRRQAAHPQQPSTNMNERPVLTREYVERHARPGESWDAAFARLLAEIEAKKREQ